MLLVAVVSVVLCVAIRFGPHLAWVTSWQYRATADVRGIPSREMVEVVVPEDWVEVQWGELRFSLPPDVAATRSNVTNSDYVEFRDGSSHIAVSLPGDYRLTDSYWRYMFENLPDRGEEVFSNARLQAEIYAANADDFSWWMSPNELKWHRWRMDMALLLISRGVESVEIIDSESVEGVLAWDPDRSAVFEWYSRDGSASGSIIFDLRNARDSGYLDRIRAVCGSVEHVPKGTSPRDGGSR